MSLLKSLEHLLGAGHPQQAMRTPDPNLAQHIADNQPVDPRYAASHPRSGLQAQQAMSTILGNNTNEAHAYNHAMARGNFNAPAVMHNDPANFGYPADNSGMRLQVNRFVNSGQPQAPNLGVNSYPAQGQFNPGATPLQGSYPVVPSMPGQATPQFGASNGPQNLGHFNPQVRDNGFYWN